MSGTSNAVAVRDPAALAIKPGQTTWDDFQNAALNQLGLKNASNADRAVFLHQCQRTGLDPFAKQIMMIERREKQGNDWVSKWTIQTGIEGWRTIRDRAEKREGLRGILSRFTYYDHEDNERKVWTRPEPPTVVEVTYTVVERGGREVPYTSQLRYSEYVQTREQNGQRVPIAQWLTKPVHMTEKCTEADVYRKTFPQDYAGIELSEAMPEPDPDAPPIHVQSERIRVTADQARERRGGTDWKGAAERGAERFAQTVPATVVTPEPATGDAVPPADPEAAAPSEEMLAARKRAQAQADRVFAGMDQFARLVWAARIIRAEHDDDVKSFDHLTLNELRLVADTLHKCKDVPALEKLLAAGEVTADA